jgi:hypothetical protein
MAPEQAAGRPVGPEADWYSVGAMLYEALTGRAPFEGPPFYVMLDKQRRVPEAPSLVRPGVAADLSELCMELLRIEPERRPAGSAVVERLRGSLPTESDERRLSLPAPPDAEHGQVVGSLNKATGIFVGRESELRFLEAALADVRRGEQVTVYLQGESGIGKSELISAFARSCAKQGVIHLHGRCYERETVAYKGVDGLMEDLAAFMRNLSPHEAALLVPRRAGLLLRVFPSLTRVSVLERAGGQQAADPHVLRSQLFEAFRELFLRLCERYTVLITIDDLQWSDAEGLALLSELLRKPAAPPLLFIASWRSAHAGEALGHALEALPRDARSLPLGRLSELDAQELARHLLAQAGGDPSSAVRVAESAAGHPILIDELARFAAVSRVEPAAVRVEDAMWSRIEQLAPNVRAVLELYAIASTPLSPAVVARAAALSPTELSRHIASLRVLHLLRSSALRPNQATELYHDSVRRAVVAHLDAGAQRALHRALATALRASQEGDWEALATHFQGAGEHDQAAQYLLRGAEQAEHALAFGHAAQLYARALALWPDDHPERMAVHIRMGDALGNVGRGFEAAQAYSAALAGADAAQALDLKRRAAQQLLLTGHVDEGLARLAQVLRAEGITLPKTPAHALATILYGRCLLWLRGFAFQRLDPSLVAASARSRADVCWRVGIALGLTDVVRGHSLCLRAVFEALRTGDAYLVSRAIAAYAAHVSTAGSAVETKVNRMLDQSHALAAEVDSPHALGFVLAVRGQVRYLAGWFRSAVQYSAEAERLLRERCVNVPFELDTTRLWTMRALLSMGEFAAVSDKLPAMLDECRQRADLYGEVNLRASVQTDTLLALGRPDDALDDIVATERLWSPVGYHVQHFYFALGKTSVALYAGRHPDAIEQARQLRLDVSRSLLKRVQRVRIGVQSLGARTLLASMTHGAALTPAALRAVEDAADAIQREHCAYARPQAQLLRAGVASLRGHPDKVVAALREARSGFEAMDMRAHAACTSIRLGRILAGDEGRALVEHGLALLETQRVATPERLLGLLAPGFKS